MKTRNKLLPLQALPVIRTAPNQPKGKFRGGIGIVPQYDCDAGQHSAVFASSEDDDLYTCVADCDYTYDW